ncbi:MAG: hypothetical protein J7539_17260 [Niabella sp.]|nr:hypothetical protein [Niabella sp.]
METLKPAKPMSHTRYVKGKIVKRTTGSHNMYAQESIVLNAVNHIDEWGKEGGVRYGEPEAAPKREIEAQCMVQFRPHGNWQGEYGFDWFRGGDSGLNTDPDWFGKIVGKHYTDSTFQTVLKDTNFWSLYFKQDWDMYNNILKTFKCYDVPWNPKIRGNSYLYPVPIMTMLKGEKHLLTIKAEVNEPPGKITLRQKKSNKKGANYFKFSIDQIPVRKGKYTLNNYLEITCVESFTTTQIIEVLADGIPCGWLKIVANDPRFYNHIPVVIIPVISIVGAVPKMGNIVNDGEAFFKQGLKQAYAFPYPLQKGIVKRSQPLNLIKTKFDSLYCNNTNEIIRGDLDMLDFLDSQLQQQFPDQYTNFYKLYFLPNSYPTYKNGNRLIVQGFSDLKTFHGVYFQGHDRSTVTHETLHAIGLPHTFDGSQNAKFSYKAQQTDNIMDYCHWSTDGYGHTRTPVLGKSLFGWQMKTVNNVLQI